MILKNCLRMKFLIMNKQHKSHALIKEITFACAMIFLSIGSSFLGSGLLGHFYIFMWLFLIPIVYYNYTRPLWAGFIVSFISNFGASFFQLYYQYQKIPHFLQNIIPKMGFMQGAAGDAVILSIFIILCLNES